MSTPNPEPNPLRPVADLLADYLSHAPNAGLPGCDGALIEDVLAGYEELAAAGRVPSEAELCQRHPHLAGRLVAFFHLQHPPDAG